MKRANILLLSLTLTTLAISSNVFLPSFCKEVSDTANEMTTSLKDPAKIKQKKAEQEKADNKMIEGMNEIPGVEVDKDAFKEKKGFSIGDLNPFKWVFKPVTDMQEKVVHLEKQIMRLEGPIASLHKPIVDVRGNMVEVQEQMEGVSGDMSSVEKRLAHIEQQLDKMYPPVSDLKGPIQDLAEPITGLREQLNIILIAIYAVGFLVCFGTPVAALFAYRYRFQIMKKLGGSKNASKMEEETSRSPAQVRMRRNEPASQT